MNEEKKKHLNEEIAKKFSAEFYYCIPNEELAEIMLHVPGGGIDLAIFEPDDDETCYIQYQVSLDSNYSESILTKLYQLCIILKDLFVVTRELAEIDVFGSEEREDICIRIEYTLENYTVKSVIYILEAFSQVDLRNRKIDKEFLKCNYEDLYDILIKKSTEVCQKFKRIVESEIHNEIYCSNISTLKPIISGMFSERDCVYSDYRQKICVGFTQEGIDNYIKQLNLKPEEFSEYYEGVNYNIMTVSGDTYVWEKRLWLEAYSWLHTLEMNYGDIPVYKACAKGRIILRVVEFWICIMSESDAEEKIIYEKNILQEMQKKYLNNVSSDIFELEYDFSKLTPEKFEMMCCDVLCAEGYKNVQRRGNLYAADGGVDIEAVEIVKGIVGNEEKKWIFQCKKSKKSIDRKELNEIPLLLKEFEADRYGLFCTASLTPGALNRCKQFDRSSIYIFDENLIKQKLKEHIDVANKYFQLYNISMRT